MMRRGSAKANCAAAMGTPCLSWFSRSLFGSHSRTAPSPSTQASTRMPFMPYVYMAPGRYHALAAHGALIAPEPGLVVLETLRRREQRTVAECGEAHHAHIDAEGACDTRAGRREPIRGLALLPHALLASPARAARSACGLIQRKCRSALANQVRPASG